MGSERWDEVCRSSPCPNGQGIVYGGATDPQVVDEIQKFKNRYADKKKVLISEPTLQWVDYRTHDSLIDMAFHMARYEARSPYKFFKTTMGRMIVAYSREKFAETAVDNGFDYILYLDDDHLWPKDLFERLQSHLEKYDIVAPLCLQRLHPYNPVIYKTVSKKHEDGKIYEESVIWDKFEKGDLVTDADAIGFGTCIINCNLFKKIPKPWFFCMQPVGEDILFCNKAKQVGAKILVDTSIEAPHIREGIPVTWSDHERAIKKD